MDVIYSDRYGPSGPPPWLLGCHGDCEALGWVPVSHLEDPNGWCDPEGCDGWHMVRCSTCGGSGRASRRQVIGRLPAYVVRGLRSTRWMLFTREAWRQYRAPWTSRRAYVLIALKAAWT